MKKTHVNIQGMHCDGCVESVRSAIIKLDGVTACDVQLHQADVVYDPSRCGVSDIAGAVRQAGAFEIAGFSTAGA
ncbi:MAG: heavy-metal-associated domain-containing protein [Phycisphaerae bacterium]